jgi:ubiquinone/menaquinone biosynthesis C-methylase UbiE
MNNYQGYVNKAYLENASQVFNEIKQFSYDEMRISSGNQVLDVGCGPGIDVVQLTKYVTEAGKVFGVDHDKEMIENAKNLSESENVADRVELNAQDVTTLSFESDFFDSCRSERVFMHLENPLAALKEMHRVTKPKGRVVVIDSDWSSLSIDSNLVDTENTLLQFYRNKVLTSGYAGRSLFRLFRETGFTDIQIKIFPLFTLDLATFSQLIRRETVEDFALEAGVISKVELEKWRDRLQKAAEGGCFFGSMNIISVSGEK